jgi:hypothetical protein
MMLGDKRAMSRTATLLLICASALALAGCESARKLNPFAEKDKILPGDRRPVFEQGSGFEGPRKLPPPNSDYVGATMQAGQEVPPAAPPPPPAPGTAAPPPSDAAPGTEPVPITPPPQ